MPAISNATVQAVGSTLSIELPRSLAPMWPSGTPLSILSHGPDAATVVKGEMPSGLISGTLSTFSLAELFNHVTSGVLSGKLVISGELARRSVMFRDGQVIFAFSSANHERLGASLVSNGVLTEDQLKLALTKVGPGAKLGQVLTQTGVLTPSRMYGGMVQLVREIVTELFTVTEGEFIFIEGAQGDESVKLQERTKELVLEGMRRAEEVRALRRDYPSELVVRGAADTELPAWAERAASGITLEELWVGFEGSEHAFLTRVKAALSGGVLKAETEEEDDGPITETSLVDAQDEARSELELYGELVRIICYALIRTGQKLDQLRSFLLEPLPSVARAFEGVTLSDEGVLDFDRIRQNIGAVTQSKALARAQTYEAIDAFISYALFSAKNVLKPELANQLNREFMFLQKEHS